MTFEDLRLDKQLLQNLQSEGYTQPTPIQQQAIPIVLQGDDLIGCAQTGTGKTAAFSLPLLQILSRPRPARVSPQSIRALILSPTRELTIQIAESVTVYGKGYGIRNVVIFGGVSAHHQIEKIRRGTDILVATPGRLLDLLNQGIMTLKEIEVLILDEADRMLDMGFIHDINRIVSKLPTERQTLLFSATMSPEVKKIADKYLRNPKYVTVTPVKETQKLIEESLYFIEKPGKAALLEKLIRDFGVQKGVVFTRTKHGADKLTKSLQRASISASAIHGNKSQEQRQKALDSFKKGNISILVATDIAARGLDIDDVTHVFNYEIPEVAETYVHRIGRTGRAGSAGIAISFCDTEERKYVSDIQKLTKKQIPVAGTPEVEMRRPQVVQSPQSQNQGQSKAAQVQNGHSKPAAQPPVSSTGRPEAQKSFFTRRRNRSR